MIYNKEVFVAGLNQRANPDHITAQFLQEVANYGFVPSEELLGQVKYINTHELRDILDTLCELRGEGSNMVPMYPNFPDSVLERYDLELYFNAIIHYLTGLLPYEELRDRLPYSLDKEPIVLGYGGLLIDALPVVEDFVKHPVPMNPVQVEFMCKVFDVVRPKRVVEDYIPIKENLALYVSGVLKCTADVNTIPLSPKDALRVAHVYGGGDATGDTQRIPSMPRGVRRWLLRCMDLYVSKNPLKAEDDFALNREPMKRLAEKLHPYEMARGLAIAKMFLDNREGNLRSVNSRIEQGLEESFAWVKELLVEYPGRFARMLNRLLLQFPDERADVVSTFSTVTSKVDTKLLLSLREYFGNRNDMPCRFFIPKKGGLVPIPGELEPLPGAVVSDMVSVMEQGIIDRMPSSNELGKIYIDPALEKVKVPSMDARKVSEGMNVLPRGSRVPAPDAYILRCFIHWKNLAGERESYHTRVDIDLSVILLDEDWDKVADVTYYNLRHEGVTHSGDIVDAPSGASEYIDVRRSKVPDNVRYVLMTIHSYTQQLFTEVPELYAGWMARDKGMSGKVFEPTSVEHAISLTSGGQVCTLMAVDLVDNEIVWLDIPSGAYFINCAHFSGRENRFIAQALFGLNRAVVADLVRFYAQAGGNELVDDASDADTVFDIESVLDNSITELLR